MTRKPKFKPVITRVKLNPEQAVLTCSCYGNNRIVHFPSPWYQNTAVGGVGCTGGRTHHQASGSAIPGPCFDFENGPTASS